MAHGLSEHAAGGKEIIRHQRRRADGLPIGITIIDDLDGGQIRLDGLRDGVRREWRLRWLKIMREPHGDLAFDADTDEIFRGQRHTAGVNAFCKYAATAGVRNSEILLHHRAGAADLVTDQRAEIGGQQIMKRILNAVSVGLVLRRGVCGERLQRPAVAAGSSNDSCSREDPVHRRQPSGNAKQNAMSRQRAMHQDARAGAITPEYTPAAYSSR